MIDLLSAQGKHPIVVGDDLDMVNLVTMDQPRLGETCLLFRNGQGEALRIEISDETANLFSAATHVCIVALAGSDIAYARLMDLRAGTGRTLSSPEIQELTKEMVSGDFHLTHIPWVSATGSAHDPGRG